MLFTILVVVLVGQAWAELQMTGRLFSTVQAGCSALLSQEWSAGCSPIHHIEDIAWIIIVTKPRLLEMVWSTITRAKLVFQFSLPGQMIDDKTYR